MTKKEKEQVTFRWKGLCDFRMALAKYNPEVANPELFFQEKLLGAESYFEANKILLELEECDKEAQELYGQLRLCGGGG